MIFHRFHRFLACNTLKKVIPNYRKFMAIFTSVLFSHVHVRIPGNTVSTGDRSNFLFLTLQKHENRKVKKFGDVHEVPK